MSMMGKRRSSPGPDLLVARPSPLDDKVMAMIHPSDQQLDRPRAVRDGQGAPVTCAACGCRLTGAADAWFHFSPMGGRDARGCRIACADAAHDVSGRPVAFPA
jgi:hypothetical protein